MNPFVLQNYINYQMLVRNALIQSHLQTAQLQSFGVNSRENTQNVIADQESGSDSAYYSETSSENGSLGTGHSAVNSPIKPRMYADHKSECKKQCSFCPATFKSNTDVKRHERIHTGEKPFSCSVCQKSFNRKGNMEKHLTTHFKGKDRLEHLKMAHATEKNFICHCGKAFRSRGFFYRHQRQHELVAGMVQAQEKCTEDKSTKTTSFDDSSDFDGLPSFVIKSLIKKERNPSLKGSAYEETINVEV